MDMQSQDAAPITKADLNNGLHSLGQDLRSEMAGLGQDLRSEMAEFRNELKSEIASVRRELIIEIIKTNGRIDRLEQSLKDQMSAESSKILKAVEDFWTKCEKVDHNQIITRYRVDELERRVKTLEMQ